MNDDINLFDSSDTEATPELVEVLNVSKYNVRLNGVRVSPGAVGLATEADFKRVRRCMIRKVVSDAAPASVDE
jgi:hypothetical protein